MNPPTRRIGARTSPRLIIALLVALAAGAGAGGALATARHTETARASGVSASFSYRGAPPAVTGSRLKIVKAGRSAYDAPVTARLCGRRCGPAAYGRNSSSVGIVPLLPGSPQVVLELYSGGANCCFIDQVFSYDPGTMSYVKTEHAFPYSGATVKRLSGQYRFVSADDGFRYAFTDGADSGAPIQIWRFTGHRFLDVTRAYPALIQTDATRWLGLFDHHIINGVGLIAAWAGDEELLGHDGLVQSTLKHELARGRLKAGPGHFFAGGATFIRELNRLLHQLGYVH